MRAKVTKLTIKIIKTTENFEISSKIDEPNLRLTAQINIYTGTHTHIRKRPADIYIKDHI